MGLSEMDNINIRENASNPNHDKSEQGDVSMSVPSNNSNKEKFDKFDKENLDKLNIPKLEQNDNRPNDAAIASKTVHSDNFSFPSPSTSNLYDPYWNDTETTSNRRRSTRIKRKRESGQY